MEQKIDPTPDPNLANLARIEYLIETFGKSVTWLDERDALLEQMSPEDIVLVRQGGIEFEDPQYPGQYVGVYHPGSEDVE